MLWTTGASPFRPPTPACDPATSPPTPPPPRAPCPTTRPPALPARRRPQRQQQAHFPYPDAPPHSAAWHDVTSHAILTSRQFRPLSHAVQSNRRSIASGGHFTNIMRIHNAPSRTELMSDISPALSPEHTLPRYLPNAVPRCDSPQTSASVAVPWPHPVRKLPPITLPFALSNPPPPHIKSVRPPPLAAGVTFAAEGTT